MFSYPSLTIATLLFSLASHGSAQTTGCGKVSPHAGGHTNYTIQVGSSDRRYLLHIPSTYQKDNLTPLIFSFHGHNKNNLYQETLSRFSEESINPNMISVYPMGLHTAWQGAPYADSEVNEADSDVNDLAFTNTLLDFVESNYCIDKSRIYASGKSIGGGFVHILACDKTVGGRFAAFAPVAGAYYKGNPGDACSPARSPMPILEFHGLKDTIADYTGGTSHDEPLPKIRSEFMAGWALRNGCATGDAPKPVESAGGLVRFYDYKCNTQHYVIEDLGHDWPSLSPNLDNDDASHVEASAKIIEFFNAHTKP